MSPAEAACAALGVGAAEIVSVEPVKHGLTNDSWLVRTRTAAVVVRISSGDEDALRIDRASEATILRAVAAANIGAPVLVCAPQRRLLVTSYLGPPWSAQDAAFEESIRRLAELLYRLHALQPPQGVRIVDLAETVEGYRRTLEEHGAGGDLVSDSMRARAQAAAARLRIEGELRLCHNDVHHLNLIESDGLRLIDWEYAGLGDPSFDLASVCVYQQHGHRQREALLSAYVAAGGSPAGSRFEAALWLFKYVRDLWTACREVSRR
ncbi:MAG: choline/ethanolamine kinase family protein [Steroidobacteraceae bacterium]|jgi:thiamine kinase|nr:choline/ethanolamine kinase family protein [Steroidobacteraceae bacterium]